MKERPILFSAPMVRAILEGRKTQTRRVVKGSYIPIVEECLRVNGKWVFDTMEYELTTPYGRPGDRLWVRETWQSNTMRKNEVYYAADQCDVGIRWRPSIHMPRWASRITLEVIGVRVERLQEISEADAAAEGTHQWIEEQSSKPFHSSNCNLAAYPVTAFARLWESINGEGSWAANPWVWVIEFKRV